MFNVRRFFQKKKTAGCSEVHHTFHGQDNICKTSGGSVFDRYVFGVQLPSTPRLVFGSLALIFRSFPIYLEPLAPRQANISGNDRPPGSKYIGNWKMRVGRCVEIGQGGTGELRKMLGVSRFPKLHGPGSTNSSLAGTWTRIEDVFPTGNGNIPLLLLMVQKSHSQPPGIFFKPVVNNGISTTFPSTGE